MKPPIMTVVGALIVVVVVVAILGLARVSQSDQHRANAEADLHTAKAMRFLAKFQANLAQIALLRDQLSRQLGDAETPVAVPPKGSGVEDVVRDRLEDFKALSEDLRNRARKSPSRKLDERARRLAADASAITEAPRLDLGQNEASITKGLANALKRMDKLIAENARFLKSALTEADAALRVQYGQANTQNHVNANHLRAFVLYLQAEVKRSEGLAARLEAQLTRLRALRLIDQAAAVLGRIEEVENRKPAQLAASLAQDRAVLEKRLARTKKRLADLTKQVDVKKTQIASNRARAQAARKALQALEAKGYDPKKPADVKRYVAQYAKQATLGREAGLKAAALEAGTLDGARLDDALGGNLLKDRYVPEPGREITVVKGLRTLEKERAEVEKEVTDIEALLGDNALRAEQVKSLTAQLDARRDELVKDKTGIDNRVTSLLAEAGKRAEAAAKAEADALGLLDKAGKAYARAARAARNRGGELMSDPSMEDMPKDKDTQPAMIMAQADVAHVAALVHLQRVRDLGQQIATIEAAAAAKVGGVDATQVQELADELAEARAESVKAIDASIKLLIEDRAIRSVNKNYRWIPQVSVASSYQLKSLLTADAAAAEALDEAIAQYEQAVEGREGSPFLKPYVRMLERVRAVAGREAATLPAETQPAATKPAESPKPAAKPPAGRAPPKPAPKAKPKGAAPKARGR